MSTQMKGRGRRHPHPGQPTTTKEIAVSDTKSIHQPRERAVQCSLCPPGRTTWNVTALRDAHEAQYGKRAA